jgi:hypothetical protein
MILVLILFHYSSLGESRIASQELLDSADAILEKVSEIRQLQILRPVEKGIKSRTEIRAFLLQKIAEEYPKAEVEEEERLLKRLGLLPQDFDLYTFMPDLLTEQLAGYYDPEAETFYIADWLPLLIQEPVMAHELTHALQDQHFDLEAYLEPTEGNDDSTLARSALIEGEGLLVMLDYALKPMGRSSLDIPDIIEAQRSQTAMMDAQFEIYANAPNYLRETLLFPYTYGANFLQEVVRRHSWPKVNEIYNDLPKSTEQILHPAKYLVERDEPTPVKPLSPGVILKGSWCTVCENVMGEFVLYLLLREFLDDGIATRASKGWDGDSIQLLENSQGKEAMVLDTVWDTDRDAEQFQTAYLSLVKKKFPDLRVATAHPLILGELLHKVQSWEDEHHAVTLTSAANRVLVVESDK